MENYTKIKTIGKGTFGSVKLVARNSDQKKLAIKKIYLSGDSNQSPTNEIKILESIHHPNIIKYHESFVQQNKFYIVTDYAQNGDLSQLIKSYQKQNLTLSESFIFSCLHQITNALIYLHDKKILHRDLKTQNILLDESNNVKIGDFGISKQLTENNELAQTSLGTPYYLSPEICKNQQYDHKTDMWMLGCVLYEMLTLDKPFRGNSLNDIINNILYSEPAPIQQNYDPKLIHVVKLLLLKSQQDRINIHELKQILNQKPIPQQKIFPKCESLVKNQQHTPTTNESEIKKKKVQISIVTQNLNNQQFRPGSDKQGLLNMLNDEFSENRPKSFSFGKTLFNGQTPTSPQRQILFQEFLKKRLGEELFDKSMAMIKQTNNPLKFLEDQSDLLIQLIGEDNKETLKCFKMLFMQPQQPENKRFNFNNYKY